ncbi:MAG: LLM class oxidoreductase [Pseudomonadota bacterium]
MTDLTLDPALATHPGYARTFQSGRLTLGLMFPMGPLVDGVPDMRGQVALAQRAEAAGFAALWSRDVPLFDPGFNDAGQIYDPWVWLAHVAAHTETIALSTAGIVLPLRHPLHVAKAAASIDTLSGGRYLLGMASGDRAAEYPAFGIDRDSRGQRYREGVEVIRRATQERFPDIDTIHGHMSGLDFLPKPPKGRLPLLAVGSARQSVQWLTSNMDGWVTYPRPLAEQKPRVDLWRRAAQDKAPGVFKPFAQSLFIDLTDDPDGAPSEIFLGYRFGRNRLIEHLDGLQDMGVNHVTINLRHSTKPPAAVIDELGDHVLQHFPTHALVPASDPERIPA